MIEFEQAFLLFFRKYDCYAEGNVIKFEKCGDFSEKVIIKM